MKIDFANIINNINNITKQSERVSGPRLSVLKQDTFTRSVSFRGKIEDEDKTNNNRADKTSATVPTPETEEVLSKEDDSTSEDKVTYDNYLDKITDDFFDTNPRYMSYHERRFKLCKIINKFFDNTEQNGIIISKLKALGIEKDNFFDFYMDYCKTTQYEGNNREFTINYALNKKLGIKDIDSFKEIFSHLGEKYNKFATDDDEEKAIQYTLETFDDKIRLIDELASKIGTNNNNNNNNNGTAKIYFNYPDIIDYFYEQNGEESLEGLQEIMRYVAGIKKTSNGCKLLFNEYEKRYVSPIHKIEAFKFLNVNGIHPNDLNDLVNTSKSVVRDVDTIERFNNYTKIIDIISRCTKQEQNKAKSIYTDFADILIAAYDTGTKNEKNVEAVLKIIEKNGIKNQNKFLTLYKNVYNTPDKEKLTKDEIKDFIEIAKFTQDYNFIKDKNKKITYVSENELRADKKEYERIKPALEKYLDENQNAFFNLNTPLKIFKKQKENLRGRDLDSIYTILCGMEEYNIDNQKEYNDKIAIIGEFRKYFKDDKDIRAFLLRNELSLDKEDKDDRKYYLSIFEALGDDEELQNIIKNTDFLKKSKAYLKYLVSESDNETIKEVIRMCNAEGIDSIEEFVQIIEQIPKANIRDSLHYIKHYNQEFSGRSAPNFSEYCKKVGNLLVEIQNNMGVEFNYTNIQNIGYDDYFINGEYTPNLISKMFGDPNLKNPMTQFKKTFISLDNVKQFDTEEIAEEIIWKIDTGSEESYAGLKRILNLEYDGNVAGESNSMRNIKIKRLMEKEKESMEKLTNLVNSTDWLYKNKDNGKVANMTLHAKLRLIDRYIIQQDPNIDNIDKLCTEENKEKLKNILKIIYEDIPEVIEKNKESIYSTITKYGKNQRINVIYTPNGVIKTVAPLKKISRSDYEGLDGCWTISCSKRNNNNNN